MIASFRCVLALTIICCVFNKAILFAQSPAVVNPVVRSPLRETTSLDGQWEFATDANDVGEKERWFDPGHAMPGSQTIRLPGRRETQALTWYKKSFDLRDGWINKKLWLKIGGVSSPAWIWVNGRAVGHLDSDSGSCKFDIGQGLPMEVITVAIKARGGIDRSVEIDATGPVLIDNAFVESKLDNGKAIVHVKVQNPGQDNQIDVSIYTAEEKLAGHATAKATANSAIEITLDPLRPWSPEEPNLYQAEIVLRTGDRKIDGWTERFGLKKTEFRDGQFYLNNAPYVLHKLEDDTICSPVSREEYSRQLRMAKTKGFNYVHTPCALPEFYEAADEIGMIVQPDVRKDLLK